MPDFSDSFGGTNPRRMPRHLFTGALKLDLSSAVRANVDRQNYSVCPRHWYIDATFRCRICREEFTWTVDEQRTWFEEYGFYIDSKPNHCARCRKGRRLLKSLRQEYDRTIGRVRAGGSLEEKKRLVQMIDEILAATDALEDVPESILDALILLGNSESSRTAATGLKRTRDLLLKQIKKTERVVGSHHDAAGEAQPPKGEPLFSDLGEEAFFPEPVEDYPLTHYLRLSESADDAD